MARKLRKSKNSQKLFLDPIMFKAKIIQKGKLFKPLRESSKKIEIKVEIREGNYHKVFNCEAYSTLAYSISRRLRKKDTVVIIGQPTIYKGYYSKREYLMLDSCYSEEVYRNSVEFRIGQGRVSKIEAERLLTKDMTYAEIEEKYLLSNRILYSNVFHRDFNMIPQIPSN